MASVIVRGALVATVLLAGVGCSGTVVVRDRPEGAVIVQEAPPPAEVATTVQVEPPALIVEARPAAPAVGYVWVDGYWARHHDRWVWVAGRWHLPPRHGQHWVAAHWEHRGPQFVFVAGYWR